MTNQIIITSRSALEAAVPFVSNDETKRNINGIRFDSGLMVATDGVVMAVIKPRLWWSDCDAAYTVSSETIENVLNVRPLYNAHNMFVIARIAEAQSMIEVHECIGSVPDYSRLIPEKIAEGHSILEYVNRTSKLLAIFPIDFQESIFPNWKRVIPPIDKFKNAPQLCRFTAKLLARLASLGETGSLLTAGHSTHVAFIADTRGRDFDAIAIMMPTSPPIEIEYPNWLSDAVFPQDNGSTHPVNSDSSSNS